MPGGTDFYCHKDFLVTKLFTSKKHKVIGALLSLILLLAVFNVTSPVSAPLLLLVVPFLLLFVFTYLVLNVFLESWLISWGHKTRIAFFMLWSTLIIFILMLRSLNQLTIVDLFVLVVLGCIFSFYFSWSSKNH